MLQHNLLLAYRSFKRFKNSFFINLLGLTTGLACALLIYLWVKDELNVDKFNANDSRLFQLMNNVKFVGSTTTDTYAWTPFPLAEALRKEMPEVENAVSVFPYLGGNKGLLKVGDLQIKAGEQFASRSFFSVFSYPLLQGDPTRVLAEKNSVAISDEVAYKLFHTTGNVVGRTLEWEQGNFTGAYMVSGVFQKPPRNATGQFDIVFPFELFREKNASVDDWGEASCVNYVVLKEGVTQKQFSQKLARWTRAKAEMDTEYSQFLFVRKFSDAYLYDKYENGQQVDGRIVYVKLFSIIAIFIVVVACINFMNLSTAKASRRIKEVGIKKAIGAPRGSLIAQFLGESVLVTFVSLLLAVVLVWLLVPWFSQITGKQLTLSPDGSLVLMLLGITLLTGLVAGSYPALYLSGFQPALVLKGKLNTSSGEVWARRGLVVFQFTISIVLIVSVLVVYKQIQFIQTKNLGYNRHNVIMFKKEGKLNESLEAFLQEVKQTSGVINASNTWGNMTQADNYTGGLTWEGAQSPEPIRFASLQGNYDLIETLGMQLKEGRAFSRGYGLDTAKIMFNEAAIAQMGLKDPVGKTVTLWNKPKEIIGVVKNFHFESLHEKVKPCFIILTPEASNILVRIKAGTEKETINQLQRLYQEYNPGLQFDYKFLASDFQAMYAAENRVAVLSKYFAGVAIFIACLGLYGLAAFTAERRRKEIGIRKILGSSEMGIARLLSNEFMKMVLAAILIALPISLLIARKWLDGFAYRIDLEWWYFAGAGLATLLIALFTVASQTVNAANVNPTDCLRKE